MEHHSTDCRTENGVTVGLIDGLLAIVRVLRDRNLDAPEVHAALSDLAADEDMQYLIEKARE